MELVQSIKMSGAPLTELQPISISNNPIEENVHVADFKISTQLRSSLMLPIIFFIMIMISCNYIPNRFHTIEMTKTLSENAQTKTYHLKSTIKNLSTTLEVLKMSICMNEMPPGSMIILEGSIKVVCYKNNTILHTQAQELQGLVFQTDSQSNKSKPVVIFTDEMITYDAATVQIDVKTAIKPDTSFTFQWTIQDPKYSVGVSIVRLALAVSLIHDIIRFALHFQNLSSEQKYSFFFSLTALLYTCPWQFYSYFYPDRMSHQMELFFHDLFFSAIVIYVIFLFGTFQKSISYVFNIAGGVIGFILFLLFLRCDSNDTYVIAQILPKDDVNTDKKSDMIVNIVLLIEIIISATAAITTNGLKDSPRYLNYVIVIFIHAVLLDIFVYAKYISGSIKNTAFDALLPLALFSSFTMIMLHFHYPMSEAEMQNNMMIDDMAMYSENPMGVEIQDDTNV